MIAEAIKAVVAGQDLDATTMGQAMGAILNGDASEAQIAALAVGLRMKGETAVEIAAAARAMRAQCTSVSLGITPLLDTCGTGGDGSSTFNISTVSAIVVASCGVSVAKHGNRAVSSKSGSADLLEALGVRIDAPVQRVKSAIEQVGIGFLFAPAHHAAMRHAAPVRKQLGLRTFFNLLGPLSNPAGATHQLLGVYSRDRIEQLAQALGELGVERAWVVHGRGLDEVSTEGVTDVAVLDNGTVTSMTLSPSDFGVEPVPLAALSASDPEHSKAIALDVIAAKQGPHRTAVLINAAAALVVAGRAADPKAGVAIASDAIDSGKTESTLKAWVSHMAQS